MALTPEDVVNKRFNPTKFREGYDQDEVDDFLDEVVVELRRLGQENEELRQRLAQSESQVGELQRGGAAAAPAAAAPAPAAMPAPTAFPAPMPAAEPAYAMPEPAAESGFDASNTNNLLQLARRLHEEHVREGVEKRDALIAEGHAAAARIVQEAEQGQRDRISELEQERATLEQERAKLERSVEELRTFESEYREKLRDYIQGQLQELEASRPVGIGARSAQPSLTQQPSFPAAMPAPETTEGFAAPESETAYAVPAPETAYPAPAPSEYPAPAPQSDYAAYPQPPQYPGFAGGN